ncbi:MAG: hypothetical protein K2M45_07985 [Muribaculaceae bacterium]|nr:hypothetical protein [Muribaculaceae bacterium]
MTPEEIKKTWAEAARKMYHPTPDEFESIFIHKKETALERLVCRYRRFSLLSLSCAFMSAAWLMNNSLFYSRELGHTIQIAMIVYFALCSILDFLLSRGVASINCYKMTVKEVIEKAVHYRKRHLQSMMFLFPFALIVIGMMVYSFQTDVWVLAGIFAGAVVGFFGGLIQFRKFMNEYKEINETV